MGEVSLAREFSPRAHDSLSPEEIRGKGLEPSLFVVGVLLVSLELDNVEDVGEGLDVFSRRWEHLVDGAREESDVALGVHLDSSEEVSRRILERGITRVRTTERGFAMEGRTGSPARSSATSV